MRAEIDSLSFDINGNLLLTFRTSKGNLADIDKYNGKTLELTIKEYKEKRSLDANAYMWTLLNELAKVLQTTKEKLYRHYVQEYGSFTVVCVQEKAVESLCEGWEGRGLGWITDTMQSKLDGCINVLLYYGSSVYDTKELSRIIDAVVQDCKEQGIETMTSEELELLKEEWK